MAGRTGLFSDDFSFFLTTLFTAMNTALLIVLNILLCREPITIYTSMCTSTYSTVYSTVSSTMTIMQGDFFSLEKKPVPLATWVSLYIILHTRAYIIVYSRAYNTVYSAVYSTL